LHAESAALLLNPGRAVGLLRGEFARETNRERRGRCARLLAVMGDAAGGDALIEELESVGAWDEGWNYTGMGQFGRSLSPMDDAMVCLGLIKSEKARRAVIEKIRLLDAEHAFSHFRAAALYAEAVGGADLAAAIAGVLEKPAIKGHAWICLSDEFAAIPQSKVDTISRNEALRELYLARALYRCGDVAGLGARILENYSRDIRGHFARHSARALAAGA